MDAALLKRRQRVAAKARAAKRGRKIVVRSTVVTEPINPDSAYAYDDIEQRFGIGRRRLRRAEREGMKAKLVSHRKWVKGAELIKHLIDR